MPSIGMFVPLGHISSWKTDRTGLATQTRPLPTEVHYLKALNDEEVRLRAVIANDYPWHMPEFDIALNTGMRPSEMLEMTWDRVDLGRRQITILRSKGGKPRHIPLNTTALAPSGSYIIAL
jgi:integrase